jgi:SIR2-like domain
MILPSHHKYDESRKQPYTALLDRLSKVLDRDDAILFVSGYSFSDEHINAIIFDALEAKRRPHVVALQYTDPEPDSVIATRAGRYLNLMVLGPRVAYLGGRQGSWKLEETRGAEHISSAFVLDKADEEGVQSGEGLLLLGDFNRFSEFLGSLTMAPEGGSDPNVTAQWAISPRPDATFYKNAVRNWRKQVKE